MSKLETMEDELHQLLVLLNSLIDKCVCPSSTTSNTTPLNSTHTSQSLPLSSSSSSSSSSITASSPSSCPCNIITTTTTTTTTTTLIHSRFTNLQPRPLPSLSFLLVPPSQFSSLMFLSLSVSSSSASFLPPLLLEFAPSSSSLSYSPLILSPLETYPSSSTSFSSSSSTTHSRTIPPTSINSTAPPLSFFHSPTPSLSWSLCSSSSTQNSTTSLLQPNHTQIITMTFIQNPKTYSCSPTCVTHHQQHPRENYSRPPPHISKDNLHQVQASRTWLQVVSHPSSRTLMQAINHKLKRSFTRFRVRFRKFSQLKKSSPNFHYDSLSYSMNFDDGHLR